VIPRRLLAAGLAVAALVPTACSDGGPGEGEARLEVDGRAIVERHGGDKDVVDDATDLHKGDRVEITEGVARMELRRGTRMELRAGLGDAANSQLVMGTTPELEAGELLVEAPDASRVSAAGSTLAIEEGSARVTRALGVGVAVYDAVVEIDSAGVERSVPALRQMQVPALGRPPLKPRPLVYDAADPWDRRFLGSAMALGDRLTAMARGYTDNLAPGEGRTPGFFRLVLPGLDDETDFGADLDDVERAPGETLVGAAISDLGRRGSFRDRWASVFGFHDEGAAWGLVALDQAVEGDPLLGTVEQALSASPLGFAASPVATVTAPAVTAPGSGPPSPGSSGPTPTTPTTAPTSPSTAPPSQPPALPLLPEPPPTPVLESVVDPVTEVVTGLLGGLLGVRPGG
jgi:hypothetical protein